MSHQLLSSPSPARSETLGRTLCPVGSFVCTPEGTAEPLHTSKGYRGSVAVVEGPSCEQGRALGLFQYREGQHICHPPCKCAGVCVCVCVCGYVWVGGCMCVQWISDYHLPDKCLYMLTQD